MRLARRYVAALSISREVYVIVYTSETTGDALRTLGRWATDPQLSSFGWNAAAVMAKEIREATKQDKPVEPA